MDSFLMKENIWHRFHGFLEAFEGDSCNMMLVRIKRKYLGHSEAKLTFIFVMLYMK